jgi:ABC-type sugar transport system ATPase subunit
MSEERAVVLAVEGVTKRFGAVTALRELSLEVRAGEVVGLIGDNGAGKSTLVGVMSGALRPDEGTIFVDGAERSFSTPAEARAAGIETVFQNLALVPTLNIAENVFREGATTWCGWPRSAPHAQRRCDEAQRALSAGVLPPVRTGRCPLGGQRQAVAITRAVLWGSHVVLMDEPARPRGEAD